MGSCWWARRAHPLIGQAGERSNRWYEPPPPGPLRSLPASSLALQQSSSFWAPSWLQHRWGRRWGRWWWHHHHPGPTKPSLSSSRSCYRLSHPLRLPSAWPRNGQQWTSSRRCWNDDRSSTSPRPPSPPLTKSSSLSTG